MEIQKIDVEQAIYDKNDRIAKNVKQALTDKGIFAVNVMGAPGAGKTSIILALTKGLSDKCYVVEGDIESDIDTQKLQSLGISTMQINTHGACHLDAPTIENALSDIDFGQSGFLFIENIGNLVCPAEFSIGEHIKMLIVTATDGSDKPYKYPLAFEKADVIVINKADLIPYVDFDEAFFMAGVRALNPDVSVFKVCAKSGSGTDDIVTWLSEKKKTL